MDRVSSRHRQPDLQSCLDLLDGDIAVCDAIRMEVLAGARDETHLHNLRRPSPVRSYPDHPGPLRRCRGAVPRMPEKGETVGKLLDCLIAAHAIREDIPVLHADQDFAAIARHSKLSVAQVRELVPPGSG